MLRTNPFVIAGLAFLVLSASVGWTVHELRENSVIDLQARLDLVSAQTALRLEEYLDSRLLAVALVQRAMERGLLDSESSFTEQSLAVQSEFGGFQALNWINANHIITWVVPLQGNEAVVGKDILDSPNGAAALLGAEKMLSACISQPMELFQGGRGFATYFPVLDCSAQDPKIKGFVNGVFATRHMVEDALSNGLRDHYQVFLWDQGTEVYFSTHLPESTENAPVSGKSALDILDRTWDLELVPLPSTLTVLSQGQHHSFLIGGICFSFAVAAWMFFFFVRRREQQSRVAERRLARQRMAQASKMAAVGRLAGGVAHDFNNMLTAIAGSASLAALDLEAKSAPERHLKMILQVCQRAGEMTSRLLAFSRTQQLERGSCAVGPELEALKGLLKPLVREDIGFHFQVSSRLGSIPLAASEFGQIVINLVTNAVDALAQGGTIQVKAERALVDADAKAGPWLYLSVSDDGIGMSSETQDRVFEPFFTTKGAGEGTGLGLATVYGIVRSAEGSVQIETTPGAGTTLHVFLPMEEVLPSTDGIELAAAEQGVRSCNILVVEDEQAVRKVSAAILESVGHVVVAVENGQEALHYMEQHGWVDLVFTDTFMPGIGGLELARTIRKNGFDGCIIITTGYATDLSMADVRELGASFLAKPFSRTELLSLVEYCLAKGDSV